MHDVRDGTMAASLSGTPDPSRLLDLLRADDVDAALDAGLMAVDVEVVDGLDPASRQLIAQAQQRLRTAWEARERHRARAARLARRAAERDASRRVRSPATAAAPAAPGLPPAAAAALARAKARARTP